MIASQKVGKSFAGALNYNLKKLNHPDKAQRAVVLATNFAALDKRLINREAAIVRGLRPNLSNYVYHTSLNFSKAEQEELSDEKVLAIAMDYLEGMGYNNNQYIIIRHNDADHPHVHLLVNRIRFDGRVVSDSNNYKRSEALVRKLEYRYNLIAVEPGNKAAQKAPKKNEIEMAVRTNTPSQKMWLQAQLDALISTRRTMQEFIWAAAALNIHLLFNLALTGRVSGITYFHEGFKIKGQALGNRYKWSELIKNIDYEQIRDSEAISGANERTIKKYGKQTESAGKGGTGTGLDAPDIAGGEPAIGTAGERDAGDEAAAEGNGGSAEQGRQDAGDNAAYPDSPGPAYIPIPGVQISDDEDDARRRRRKRNR